MSAWIRWLLAGLLLAAAGVAGWFGTLYLRSEAILADVAPGPRFSLPIPTDPDSTAQGRHIARTRGCFGCHGQQLEGRVFSDEWGWVGVAVAPNLALYARRHDPAVIEAAVRQGIGHDGKALWSMPSYNFVLLSDSDLSKLIGFLQSAPVVEKELPDPSLGWEARTWMVDGEAQHMAEWARHMPGLTLGEGDDPQRVRGEYLAKTTCNECHGFDLRGNPGSEGATPDLAIVAAYSDEEFRMLMQHGEGRGGRTDLGLMTLVAKDRFAQFTDQERADLLAFLRTLPGKPIDQEASWRQLR